MNVRTWLLGLLAAVIGGGANTIASTFAAMQVAPATFNTLSEWNLVQTLKLAGVNFLLGALISAAGYLKQSPVPPSE